MEIAPALLLFGALAEDVLLGVGAMVVVIAFSLAGAESRKNVNWPVVQYLAAPFRFVLLAESWIAKRHHDQNAQHAARESGRSLAVQPPGYAGYFNLIFVSHIDRVPPR
jgi:hypothetical protein